MESILKRPISDISFACIDIETTGLSPEYGDRICEIAVVKFRGSVELHRFHTLVNPQRRMSPSATAVNGITDEMLRDAPTFDEILDRFLEPLDGSVVVAHNAFFDLGFLNYQLRLLGKRFIDNLVIDTLHLARRNYSFPSNSLHGISSHLGLPRQPNHRAMDDADTTRLIFESFIEDFSHIEGNLSLGRLIELQGGFVVTSKIHEIELPAVLSDAIQGGQRVKIRYISANNLEVEQEVRAKKIVPYNGYLYMKAKCIHSNKMYIFRLDRILELSQLDF
jgi:DNA polymerase-3 subunit epsilon